MIYSVDFLDTAGKINPLELCKYLKDLCWLEFTHNKRDDIRIFQIIKNENLLQVKVPLDRNLFDFKETMFETCKTIALHQDKSLERTILELLNPLSDIIRVRIDNKTIENGSILFEDAIKLYDNAKKLISSTAMSIYNEQDFFRGKLPEMVQSFIDKCRYGQTEIGSYVVSIVCPFLRETKEGPVQLSLFGEEEDCARSVTRRITKKLIKDLHDVKATIDRGGDLDVLIKNTNSKININFLEALKNLNISSEETKLEISTKWAPTIKIDENIQSTVTFNHDYYDAIKSKVDTYKNKIESGKMEIIGKIKSLSSEPIIEDRDSGTISVVTLIQEKKRVIKVILNKESYQSAILAHKNGKYIKLNGELSPTNSKLLICDSYEEIQ